MERGLDWNFVDGKAIYTQIVDVIRTKIAAGDFVPGGKLPSVRDLAIDAGVNPNTMQRALTELEHLGLVYSERTNGRFVTKDEKIMKELHKELSKSYVEELVAKLKSIGMTKEEIIDAVKSCVERQ